MNLDDELRRRGMPYRDSLNAAGIDDEAITAVLEEEDVSADGEAADDIADEIALNRIESSACDG
jgi:SOS response regulatory protein OraA/RecX